MKYPPNCIFEGEAKEVLLPSHAGPSCNVAGQKRVYFEGNYSATTEQMSKIWGNLGVLNWSNDLNLNKEI